MQLRIPRARSLSSGSRRDRPAVRRKRLAIETLEQRLVLDSTVVFNEIMYHPFGESEPNLEWIELHNQMGVDMDVSRWRLDAGVRFVFPAGTVIPGGGYLVIAAVPGALAAATGFTDALGPWEGRLNNAGEELRLVNNDDRVMDVLVYENVGPWPVAPDGSGATLAKINPNSATADANNWRASLQVGGTPGERNFIGNEPILKTVLAAGDPARVHVPADDSLGRQWTELAFDDSAWTEGPTGIGYDTVELVYADEVLADEPVGYWRFEETSGAIALDSSGNNNHGAILGNILLGQPGVVGHSARFDGSTSLVRLPGTWGGTVWTELTIEAWVNTADPITGNFQSIVSGHSPNGFAHFQLHNAGNAGVYTNGGFVAAPIVPATPTGEWRHVVLTAKSGETRVYVNGEQVGGTVADVFANISPSGNVTIGQGHEAGRWFRGFIDEVAIYNRALAPDRIVAHYFAGTNAPPVDPPDPPPSGLLAHWTFDQDARDATGNHSGTLHGGASITGDARAGGGALDLRGVNGYVSVPTGVLNGVANFTIAMYLSVQSLPPAGIWQAGLVTTVGSWTVDKLHLNLSNTGVPELAVNGNGTSTWGRDTPIPSNGTWVHLAFTYDSTAGVVTPYVNGAAGVPGMGTLRTTAGAGPLTIGSWDGSVRFFDGRMDDLRIYSGVLSAQEIAALAVTEQAAPIAGPVAAAASVPLSAYGLIKTDIEEAMFQQNASAYVRSPFTIFNAAAVDQLFLRMKYDDGFVAYLNGVEVARRNAPALISFASAAPAVRPNADAVAFETIDLSPYAGLLTNGTNVLAVQGLNAAADDEDFLILPELLIRETEIKPIALALNEVSGAGDGDFRVELVNRGATPIQLGGYVLAGSHDPTTGYVLPQQVVPAGGFVVLTAGEVGFQPNDGDRLFLYTPDRRGVVDAARVFATARARFPDGDGPWLRPTSATPGALNHVELRTEIVINEIMYQHQPILAKNGQPFQASEEMWIELYNRSGQTVDISGWRLDDGIRFDFPAGTLLGPDEYLVVAKDAASLAQKYPGIRILGDFGGRLSNSGERIVLLDQFGNPANEVHYHDGGRWPRFADGRGSSLELRDPSADNSVPEAWAASDESHNSPWVTYSYRGLGTQVLGPNNFQELFIGLLDAGEVLLDDVQVIEKPGTPQARNLVRNGGFELGDTTYWRLLGNHRRALVVVDPDNPTNRVLHLSATGAVDHLGNHIEITLHDGNVVVPISSSTEYEITFRAKWLGGSRQLRTSLYFNRLARVTILEVPKANGTPGAPNSRLEPNLGPTYTDFRHFPAVPAAGEPVTVSVVAADPQGVGAMTLWHSVNGGSFVSISMTDQGGGLYTAALGGQSAASVVQFYVEGVDTLGAVSTFPAAGPDSRALYKVDDGQAQLGLAHNVRIIMTTADANWMHSNANLMSADLLGATVVYNEHEVFYDVGVRLKGSTYGRTANQFVSFIVRFHPDQKFRGVHDSIGIDRSARGPLGSPNVDEMLIKQVMNHAGGIASNYSDMIRVIAPRDVHTSVAMLDLADWGEVFIDSQFNGGGVNPVFEFDGAYYLTRTTDGNPQSPKIVEPGPISYTDIRNLGSNKEDYRLNWILKDNRAADDYGPIIALNQAFGLTGAALDGTIGGVIDVDQWARHYALLSLTGVSDTYTHGNPHNLRVYQRPSDGRFISLPHDMDTSFQRATTSPLMGGSQWNLVKIFQRPQFTRLFYGNLYDLIQTAYNAEYMAYWTQHYGQLAGSNYGVILNYIEARSSYVLSQLNTVAPQIPFAITTNGGANFTVDAAAVSLQGSGWIDVHRLEMADGTPLGVEWLNQNTWRVTLPLWPGDNDISLTALDRRGNAVGADSIVVHSSISELPLQSYLRITELMYHPSELTPDEILAGIDDRNDFEFVELMNTSTSETLDLAGVALSQGVGFTFPNVMLAPGARIVLASDPAAFVMRHAAANVVGAFEGRLDNSGEVLELSDSFGRVIHAFRYEPHWYPATNGSGRSLVVIDPSRPSETWENSRAWRASFQDGGSPGEEDRLLGDLTGNNSVGLADVVLLRNRLGQTGNVASGDGDLNRDGVIDRADVAAMAMQFGARFVAPSLLPSLVVTQLGVAYVEDFDGYRGTLATLPPWFDVQQIPLTFVGVDDGSSVLPGFRAYVEPDGGDYSFGVLETGGVNDSRLLLAINNGTNEPIGRIDVMYDVEQWLDRSDTRQNRIRLKYNWQPDGFSQSDDLVSTDAPINTGAGQLNGKLPENRVAVHHTIELDRLLLPGETVYIRWQYSNSEGQQSGPRDGLAIDNLRVTALSPVSPSPVAPAASATAFATSAASFSPLLSKSEVERDARVFRSGSEVERDARVIRLRRAARRLGDVVDRLAVDVAKFGEHARRERIRQPNDDLVVDGSDALRCGDDVR